MKKLTTRKTVNLLIAMVWLINGLYCKVFNQVPRHEEIVATILSTDYSRMLTITIGLSEVCLAVWIITNYKQKLNAMFQMVIVALMNILEFLLIPELLLWGKLNLLFAALFIIIVYLNNFHFNKENNVIHS